MPQPHKAPTGSQDQLKPKRMALDTTACHTDRPVETCSCTTVVQDLLLSYSHASTLSLVDVLSLYLSVLFTSLKSSFGNAAVIDPLANVQNLNFDAQLFFIKVKTIACCQ